MEYNSSKDLLIMPEYGRHVQLLIEHAKTIEDDAERQAFVEQVVKLMMQMNPQSRTIEDYREKLWNHVFRIAQFDLKVMPPDGKVPTPEDLAKPDQLGYPGTEAKFRHYGHSVQQLVKKALEMEDEEKQKAFTNVIAAYMKLAYKTWNKDYFVSDEVIKEDLRALSDGKLSIAEDETIDDLTQPQRRRHGKRHQNSGGHQRRGKGNYRNKRKG